MNEFIHSFIHHIYFLRLQYSSPKG